ncbi:MAG: gliding motility-associated C-terminal domain-containing protein [Bacteroidia bacterium]
MPKGKYLWPTVANAAHYSWDFGNGESSTLLSPTVAYGDTGRFQIRLVAFTEEGCADTAMQWVWVLPELKVFIPNAFHPGGGINDVFAPTTSAEVSWHLEVYNRWGQKVWEGTNTGWDGQYKGAPAAEGVYVYKIQLLDTDRRENAFMGSVHLLR